MMQEREETITGAKSLRRWNGREVSTQQEGSGNSGRHFKRSRGGKAGSECGDGLTRPCPIDSILYQSIDKVISRACVWVVEIQIKEVRRWRGKKMVGNHSWPTPSPIQSLVGCHVQWAPYITLYLECISLHPPALSHFVLLFPLPYHLLSYYAIYLCLLFTVSLIRRWTPQGKGLFGWFPDVFWMPGTVSGTVYLLNE